MKLKKYIIFYKTSYMNLDTFLIILLIYKLNELEKKRIEKFLNIQKRNFLDLFYFYFVNQF